MCRQLLANPVIEDYAIELMLKAAMKSVVIIFPGSNRERDVCRL